MKKAKREKGMECGGIIPPRSTAFQHICHHCSPCRRSACSRQERVECGGTWWNVTFQNNSSVGVVLRSDGGRMQNTRKTKAKTAPIVFTPISSCSRALFLFYASRRYAISRIRLLFSSGSGLSGMYASGGPSRTLFQVPSSSRLPAAVLQSRSSLSHKLSR